MHRTLCDDTENKGHSLWSPQADLGFISPLGAFDPCPICESIQSLPLPSASQPWHR